MHSHERLIVIIVLLLHLMVNVARRLKSVTAQPVSVRSMLLCLLCH